MSDDARLLGGILVGGAGSRWGGPKQLAVLDGQTFLERVVAALSPFVERPTLLGAGPVPERCAEMVQLPDPPDVSGPLAGLLAALRYEPRATWLVAACDLPLLDASAVEWLLAERRDDTIAVIPRGPTGRLEPLFAAWEPAAAPRLEELARSGILAPRAIAEQAGVSTPDLPERIARRLSNVNREADLAQLRGA